MHERSLLSTSQHLTFFDNELHFLKKKNTTLKDLLDTSHLLVLSSSPPLSSSPHTLQRTEQDQLLNTVFTFLSFNTLRYSPPPSSVSSSPVSLDRTLDTLLGFESLPSWEVTGGTSQGSDLLLFTSEPYRQKYNSILQNIENLDALLFVAATEEGCPNAAHEELFAEHAPSVLPSLFDHSPVILGDDSSINQTPSGGVLISERYQHALAALRAQSQTKSLTAVYQRILKKIKKTEEQLEDQSRNVETAKVSVEDASNAVSICLASGPGHGGGRQPEGTVDTLPEPSPAPLPAPVVVIHPHHLQWEAIDIEIPAGGKVTLPLPVPLLPRTSSANDSESQLILSKELSVSWAIRSSSSSYAQVAISAPTKSTPNSPPHFDRLRSELISSDEVSRRGIQFGYVRSHEDVLSRIGESVVCGEHIIQTKDGNRVMEISNRAVWATITISYQVQIDNSATEVPNSPTPPSTNSAEAAKETQATLDREAKLREEHMVHLKALQDDLSAKQEVLRSLQQKQASLESRLHSMSGPLLLLRETFKTGIFLREKFCAQWQHWLAVLEVFHQNQDSFALVPLRSEGDHSRTSLSLAEPDASLSAAYDEQPPQSVWLQDLELLQKMIESHHELRPLPFTQIFPHLSPSSPSPCSAPTSPHTMATAGITTPSPRSFSEIPSTAVASPRVEELAEEVTSPSPPPRESLPDRILLSSSNLKIRPSSDFRCPIKIPRQPSSLSSPDVLYTLSWDFTLLSLSGTGPAAGDSSSSAPTASEGSNSSSIDIGFCVLGKSADGSFPMLTPYK
jgi:hypothetical protein